MSNETNNNAGNVSRWLIIGALGLLLIIANHLAKTIVYTLFAAGLILAGGAGAYGWWKGGTADRDDKVSLLGSIALVIVGVWILLNSDTFDKIINVVIGLVLIVTGVYRLALNKQAVQDRLLTILSVVSIVLGLIIACSHAGTTWLLKAEGFSLIYTAVTGFIGDKVLGR